MDNDENDNDVNEYSVVDQEQGYMLSFIKKSRDNQQIIKSNNQIRTNYLSKLAYEKLWLTKQSRPDSH